VSSSNGPTSGDPLSDDALDLSDDMLHARRVPPALPYVPPKSKLIDFERGMKLWPITAIFMIVLCCITFVWQLERGAMDSEDAFISAGALHRASVLKGEVWRIFTATILHGDITHLFGNMVMLYILALGVEHGFGIARGMLIYLVSALAGSLASLVMSEGPSVGASGAIFGLAGAVIVFVYRFRNRYFLRDKRIGFVLLIWAGWTVVTGFLSPGIDNWAHIGGFVGGAGLGALLPGKQKFAEPVGSVVKF